MTQVTMKINEIGDEAFFPRIKPRIEAIVNGLLGVVTYEARKSTVEGFLISRSH
jgi:hypothetical protein